MKIIDVKIKDLKVAEYNPRTATPQEAKDLQESIKRFGFVEPIIVNSATNRMNVIVGGHFRVRMAKRLGIEKIPVHYINIPDITKERELNLRLNKNVGQWDWDLLSDFDEEMLEDVGFDSVELDKIFDLDFEDDDVPELPTEAKAKYGDVYSLGKHRLMCGDATKKEDVYKLMNGNLADMVFNDPPYGVNYVGKTKRRLKMKGDESVKVFERAMGNFSVKKGATFYVCCPAGSNFKYFLNAFEKKCYHSQTIIWAKNSMVLGRNDYHFKHEPILFGWEKSGAHKFYGDRKQTTIWEVDRPTASKEHPTMKPLELCSRAIKNSSKRGEIVLDLFGGSGSTLLSCERLKRACYMMELDPRYIDVIIARWKNLTGSKLKI